MTNIQPYHFEKGLVPDFFPVIWQKRESRSQSYKTHRDYNPIKDYEIEDRKSIRRVITGFLTGIVAFFSVFLVLDATNPVNWRTLGILLPVLLVSSSVFFYVALMSMPVSLMNGHKFFEALTRLYFQFDIPINEVIGRMSKEEFRANIEEALRKKAAAVDSLTGFAKASSRPKYDRMRDSALEWELCHESDAEYFPKKVKV